MQKNICITTGNRDGVGLEVSYKALLKISPDTNAKYILVKSSDDDSFDFSLLKKFNVQNFESINQAIESSFANLCIVNSTASASQWFIDAVELAGQNKIHALCTGPLAKTDSAKLNQTFLGHTSILRSAYPDLNLTMTFLGKHFNLALLTDHIPINQVDDSISPDLITSTIKNLSVFNKKNNDSRPIAVLGLNPHAGENGLLGDFESKVLTPSICNLRSKGFNLTDPIPADTAFLEVNWQKYSFYLAMYHDQGLIPFKMLHGFDSGIQITLNLPFIRVSVDHGTATNIYGCNLANENSMQMAIEYATKLMR